MAGPLNLRSRAVQDILVNLDQPWNTMLTLKDKKTRQPISLIGATVVMKITKQFSTTSGIDLTVGSGLSIIGEGKNQLAIEGPPLTVGSYTYQIRITLSNSQQYLIGGNIIPGNG